MSAEPEETPAAQVVETQAPTTSEEGEEEVSPAVEGANGEEGDEGAGGEASPRKNGKFQRPPRDETPIEELYDLTQPIPKVDRPSKAEHEAELQQFTEAVEALRDERRKVQEKIDAAMSDPDAKAALNNCRNTLAQAKTSKAALIKQKQDLRTQLDNAKNQTDKLVKDKKDARSNVKFSTIEEIDKAIAKLVHQQETTTMTLTEEKRLIKEMDALQASKKHVVDLKSKDAAMEDVKEQRKNIQQLIVAKDKEIDALTKEIDDATNAIKELNDRETKKRDEIQELFKERDDLKKQMTDKLKEKDACRAVFREKSNAWFNYTRAVRAQKKMQYEEEKKKREEEHAAYLAKLEAEEAKKIPYEEEQALCDYLADYLERTYMAKEETKEEKKTDVVAVKDDPFAGFKPVSKKGEDEYFGKGKAKKKRERSNKKQDSAAGPFTLSLDAFEQFALIGLTPPTAIEQVEKSIKDLREKKEWYKVQPRGSVPTAAQIRKENEKAARQRQGGGGGENGDSNAPKGGTGGSGKGKGFALSNDEFVPLSAATGSSTVNASSWGQQKASSAAPAAVSEEE